MDKNMIDAVKISLCFGLFGGAVTGMLSYLIYQL